MLGQMIGGAKVKEIKEIADELMSASQLALIYNLSAETVRNRLASINQGTVGKALYNPKLAHEILTAKQTKKRRPRVN